MAAELILKQLLPINKNRPLIKLWNFQLRVHFHFNKNLLQRSIISFVQLRYGSNYITGITFPRTTVNWLTNPECSYISIPIRAIWKQILCILCKRKHFVLYIKKLEKQRFVPSPVTVFQNLEQLWEFRYCLVC